MEEINENNPGRNSGTVSSMETTICLLSVRDLLERHFFIPAYQRGYRWGKQQVTELLSDICEFSQKAKNSEEFYCLQPIVVRKHSWTKEGNILEGWEVVDGQQRLTTLRILLDFLSYNQFPNSSLKAEYGKSEFTLDYETRGGSTDFFKDSKPAEAKDIDQEYIYKAYQYIQDWFKDQEQPRSSKEYVLRALIHGYKNKEGIGTARVIWYETAEKNPVETFLRINMGKIALTNAELIKALFLQRKNYGINSELSKLRQYEIAGEWDRIENELHDEDLWAFLKGTPRSECRIEFLLDLVKAKALKKNPDLEKICGTDVYATFRYFDHQLPKDDVQSLWDEVIDCFDTIREWYSDNHYYHYLGFLIHCDVDISDLYLGLTPDADGVNVTKDVIASHIRTLIEARCSRFKTTIDNEGKQHIALRYTKDRDKIVELLLLFNIEYLVKQSGKGNLLYKFPFKIFRKMAWDVEHVDSQTENPLDKLDDRKTWLQQAQLDLPELPDELRSRIEAYLNDRCAEDLFEELQTEVAIIAGEAETDPDQKDRIGNLVLLDAGTNRAYGNALFVTKRKYIIDKDKDGSFIPPCTKNVFLKYFQTGASIPSKWTEKDMVNYEDEIIHVLETFLPKPERT